MASGLRIVPSLIGRGVHLVTRGVGGLLVVLAGVWLLTMSTCDQLSHVDTKHHSVRAGSARSHEYLSAVSPFCRSLSRH